MLIEFEKMFCTLYQAKELKKLGIKQKAYYSWRQDEDKPATLRINVREYHVEKFYSHYSAFTVAELGILLPPECELKAYHRFARNFCGFYFGMLTDLKFSFHCENEAEGRAQLILSLLENGIITVEEINAKFNKHE